MAEKTLAELKAENAKADAAADQDDNEATEEETASPPQADEVDTEDTEAEDTEADTEPDAETGDTDTEEPEDDTWMQSEGHDSDADHVFSNADMAKARRKYQAKGEAKAEQKYAEEIAALRQELEAVKGHAPVTTGLAKPKREDFYDQDDPEEAYLVAFADYLEKTTLAKVEAKQASTEKTRAAQAHMKAMETAVDQHYERAAVLAQKSNIAPETYQAADRRVRQAIEGLYPDNGDVIADQLIANLGEGSEKVFYNLGIRPERLTELVNRLTDDKSGLKASLYLGELKGRLLQPPKRRSAAPKPAADPKGDQDSPSARKLRQQYQEAHEKGDVQAAWDAKSAAKARGADVSNW